MHSTAISRALPLRALLLIESAAWHCRNDGWVGAAFNSEAPFTLEPGKSRRLRYRIVLHRHKATDGQVAFRFREYAARPVFQFETLASLTTQP